MPENIARRGLDTGSQSQHQSHPMIIIHGLGSNKMSANKFQELGGLLFSWFRMTSSSTVTSTTLSSTTVTTTTLTSSSTLSSTTSSSTSTSSSTTETTFDVAPAQLQGCIGFLGESFFFALRLMSGVGCVGV